MKRILLCSAILFWIGMAPMGSVRAQAEGPIYIVHSGNYLSTIAAQFGVSLQMLLDANGLDATSVIRPGDRLIIPGLTGINGVITTHVVDLGETLPVVSLRYALSQDAIIRLNHIVDPERVFAGEALVVTEPESGSPATPQWIHGHAVSLNADGPILALAAAEGRNPWEILEQNGLSSSADAAPGQTVLLASMTGDVPLRAWPDPIQNIAFRDFPITQGSTSEITLKANDTSSADGILGPATLHFLPWRDGLVALQGIDLQAAPEPVVFQVNASLTVGGKVAFQQDVALRKGNFDTVLEKDNVPAATIQQNAIDAENAAMASIVAPITQDQLWAGAFTPPSPHGIDANFGAPRLFNNTLSTLHHGVDYYGQMGTPIVSPAAGKIVFTGPQVICGNATVIDHGWGVYSRVCHQSKIEVGVGDAVAQGQEIGKVGKTGRATGPHLHWELWVNGVNVDPLAWVQTAFP